MGGLYIYIVENTCDIHAAPLDSTTDEDRGEEIGEIKSGHVGDGGKIAILDSHMHVVEEL